VTRLRPRPTGFGGLARRSAAKAGKAGLLADIGRTVRTERAKRGMTRKMLARQCRTSERYLAQIETGAANPSVLVLDSIARALDLDPIELMPAGRVRVTPALRPANRGRRIALIGLRGAGKSTLGARLAEALGCPLVELDKEIERERGAPVATLFEVYGQATFRRYERDGLTRVTARHSAVVIAAAGGIVADEMTFSQLLAQAHVIWIKATPAEHMRRVMAQGDFRPMARNREAMNDLIAILRARESLYARAHATLDTAEKDVAACGEELVKVAQKLLGSSTGPSRSDESR
jgi:XRE family transcriptional regulator, aerobic/anaerobic benzoate catabolism transcriptional regulator